MDFSASSNRSPSQFASELPSRAYHQPSHSASAVETSPQPMDDDDDDITTTTATAALEPISSLLLPSLSRSLTPDPTSVNPAEGIPLSRCSTAPPAESFADNLMANGKHDPAARQVTSAHKLTRMGFSAKDGSQPPITAGGGGGATVVSAPPRGPEQKSRFGIKSFFKGKS